MSEPLRVFIVDDDPDLLRVFTMIVNAESDLEVVGTAQSVADARVALEHARVDVAVLDMELPDGLGSQLIGVPPGRAPRAVILSGQVTRRHDELFAMGAAAVVTKPCATSVLLHAIRAAADDVDTAGRPDDFIAANQRGVLLRAIASLHACSTQDFRREVHRLKGTLGSYQLATAAQLVTEAEWACLDQPDDVLEQLRIELVARLSGQIGELPR